MPTQAHMAATECVAIQANTWWATMEVTVEIDATLKVEIDTSDHVYHLETPGKPKLFLKN